MELELNYGTFRQAVFADEIDAAGADITGYGFETLGNADCDTWNIGAEHIQACFKIDFQILPALSGLLHFHNSAGNRVAFI